jgi:hypothetical protein
VLTVALVGLAVAVDVAAVALLVAVACGVRT